MRTAFGLAGMTAAELKHCRQRWWPMRRQAAATRMNTLSGSMEILRGILDRYRFRSGKSSCRWQRRLARWATDIAGRFARPLIDWFGRVAESLDGMTAPCQRLQRGAGWPREGAGNGRRTDYGVRWLGSQCLDADAAQSESMVRQCCHTGNRPRAAAGRCWRSGPVDGRCLRNGRAICMAAYSPVCAPCLADFRLISDPANRQSALAALTDTWTMFADWGGMLWDSMTQPLLDMLARSTRGR